MDGTLVDSMAGVIGAWELFATKYPGLNVQEILGCRYHFIWLDISNATAGLTGIHGVRTVETLQKYCKIDDPDELQVSPLTDSGTI